MFNLLFAVIVVKEKNAWSDVYTDGSEFTEKTGETIKDTNSHFDASIGNNYITGCDFENITCSSSGGAIYCSSSSTTAKMLVESTTFTECHSSSHGGAIYFGTNGNYAIVKICGYKCSTKNGNKGPFDYVKVTNSGLEIINSINDSSISYSLSSGISVYYTLYHYYGRIIACSLNVSYTNCSGGSGIRCYPYASSASSSGEPSCIITLSSFCNNTCNDGWICLELGNGNANTYM